MNRPLIYVTAAVAAGMSLGAFFGRWGYIVAAAQGIACLIIFMLSVGLEDRRFHWALALWFCALGIVWYLFYQAPQSILVGRIGTDTVLTGEVESARQVEDRQVLTVKLLTVDNRENSSGESCRVYVKPAAGGQYTYGQVIRWAGSPELIPENGNPGAFSYRAYLQRQGVYTQIKPSLPPTVIGVKGSYLGYAAQWFAERSRQLTLGVMSPREAGVFLGILFGDTGTMSSWDRETYNTTGVLHAFAVSGSNVAFVLFFGLMIFGFLPRRLGLIAVGLLVVFYTVLTGAEEPVVRAAIMALLVLGGRLLGRRGDGLNSLAIAALLMLLVKPGNLVDPGFQLSFAATWGLIVLVPQLSPDKLNLPSWAKELILFPVAAQIATLPLLAYYFNQISLVGIAANILVTWFLALILEVGLAAVSLGAISTALGSLLLLPLVYVIKLTTVILEIMAKLPGAAFWVITPPVWLVVLYYLGLCVWVYRGSLSAGIEAIGDRVTHVTAKIQAWIVPFGVICGLIILALFLGLPQRNTLDVEFLDVGQGDAILISTPAGKHYLLDGGPRNDKFDTGKFILLPYLFGKGIKSLDGVFITHWHDDHAGGLVEVIRALEVGSLFIPAVEVQQQESNWRQPLQGAAADHKVPLQKLTAGQHLQLDEHVSLQVLAPQDPLTGTHSDPNNNSLVLELAYGNQSVLLTGDIELEALQLLKDSSLRRTSVIKIPHHGSRYGLDKEFFDKLDPPLVVISVGKNNFGQPAPIVCDYWDARNIPLLRTDRHGLIKLSTDGRKLWVTTGRRQKVFY